MKKNNFLNKIVKYLKLFKKSSIDYDVLKFQIDRGLLKGSNLYRDACFDLEELLEGIGCKNAKSISKKLAKDILDKYTDSDIEESISDEEIANMTKKYDEYMRDNSELENDKRYSDYYKRVLDSKFDSMYYKQGEIYKDLAEFSGCNSGSKEDIEYILNKYHEIQNEINEANKTKGKKVNSLGQVIKDKTFKEPDINI